MQGGTTAKKFPQFLSEKVFICPSFLKNNFSEYRILGWLIYIFHSTLFHSLYFLCNPYSSSCIGNLSPAPSPTSRLISGLLPLFLTFCSLKMICLCVVAVFFCLFLIYSMLCSLGFQDIWVVSDINLRNFLFINISNISSISLSFLSF